MDIKRNKYGLKINAICASCQMCKGHDKETRECELPIEGQKLHLVDPLDKCSKWKMHQRYTELPGENTGQVKDKRYLDFIVNFRLGDNTNDDIRWTTTADELRKMYVQQYKRSIYINF